jgi:hypothetical protein
MVTICTIKFNGKDPALFLTQCLCCVVGNSNQQLFLYTTFTCCFCNGNWMCSLWGPNQVLCTVVTHRFWACSQNYEKRPSASSCPSVRQHETAGLRLDGFSWNFVIWVFFENLWRKLKCHYNLIWISGTFNEDQYTRCYPKYSGLTL